MYLRHRLRLLATALRVILFETFTFLELTNLFFKERLCKDHSNFCYHCKALKPRNYCGGCLRVRFCNEECNNAGWKQHKEDCERQRGVLGKHEFVNFDKK